MYSFESWLGIREQCLWHWRSRIVYPSMWGFFSDFSPLCFGRGYDRVRKKSKHVITNYKITCNVNKNNNDCIEHVHSRTLITHATGIGSPPQKPTQTRSVTWSAIFTRIDARLITDCGTPIFTFIHSNIKALQAVLWGVALVQCRSVSTCITSF